MVEWVGMQLMIRLPHRHRMKQEELRRQWKEGRKENRGDGAHWDQCDTVTYYMHGPHRQANPTGNPVPTIPIPPFPVNTHGEGSKPVPSP